MHGTWRQHVDDALDFARWELVERSTCTHHQTGTCANDARLKYVSSSDGFVWSSSWFRDERLIARRSGSCVMRGPVVGISPTCDLPDAGVIDLCEAALKDVVVSAVDVRDWPDGGFRTRRIRPGAHELGFDHFSLVFVVPAGLDGLATTVGHVDDGFVLRPGAGARLGPPLEAGDAVETEALVINELGVGPRSADFGLSFVFALRPDAGR